LPKKRAAAEAAAPVLRQPSRRESGDPLPRVVDVDGLVGDVLTLGEAGNAHRAVVQDAIEARAVRGEFLSEEVEGGKADVVGFVVALEIGVDDGDRVVDLPRG
jgi:hypothetical protein